MIVWHDLNFWTGIGQIGLGVMAGVLLGVMLRRARRITRPPMIPSKHRICPSCGSPSLRRVRGRAPQRLFAGLTGRWPYACVRCNWPSVPQPGPRRRADMQTPVAPAAAPIVAPQSVLAAESLRPGTNDDATQVKDSVFRYLALLNAGDVAARANCYLSEFTSFDADGRPLKSNGVDWRAAASEPGQSFDLRCRDLRVYIHKDTAIATAYLVGTVTTPHSTATRVSGRSSWVHLRQNGEWKIAHTHLSPLRPEY